MQKNKNRKKLLLIIILIAGLIAGLAAWWFLVYNNDERGTDDINYDPPTKQEVQETEQNKEEVIKQTEAENQSNQTDNKPPDTKKTVTPVLTYWGQESPGSDFEANGRVPGVIESDGTCTLTLIKDGKSVSTKRTALANAQDTTCGLMTLKFSSLTAGDWKAILSYSSSKSQGSSSAIVVKVE